MASPLSSEESSLSLSVSEGSYTLTMDEPELSRRISNVLDELDETLDSVQLSSDDDDETATPRNRRSQNTSRGDRDVTAAILDGNQRGDVRDSSPPSEERHSYAILGSNPRIQISPDEKASTSREYSGSPVLAVEENQSTLLESNVETRQEIEVEEKDALMAQLREAVKECIINNEKDESSAEDDDDKQVNKYEPTVASQASTSQHSPTLRGASRSKVNSHKPNTSDRNPANQSRKLRHKNKSPPTERVSAAVQMSDEDLKQLSHQSGSSSSSSSDSDSEGSMKYSETGTQMDPEELEMLSRGGFFAPLSDMKRNVNMDNDTETKQDKEVNSKNRKDSSECDDSSEKKNPKIMEKKQISSRKDSSSKSDEDKKSIRKVTENDPKSDEDVPNEGEPTPVAVRRKVHFGDGQKERVHLRMRSSSDEYLSASGDDVTEDHDVTNIEVKRHQGVRKSSESSDDGGLREDSIAEDVFEPSLDIECKLPQLGDRNSSAEIEINLGVKPELDSCHGNKKKIDPEFRRKRGSSSDESIGEKKREKSNEGGGCQTPNEQDKEGLFGRLKRRSGSKSDDSDDEGKPKSVEEKASPENSPKGKSSKKRILGRLRRNSGSDSSSEDENHEEQGNTASDGNRNSKESYESEQPKKRGIFGKLRRHSGSDSSDEDDGGKREKNNDQREQPKKRISGRKSGSDSSDDGNRNKEKENAEVNYQGTTQIKRPKSRGLGIFKRKSKSDTSDSESDCEGRQEEAEEQSRDRHALPIEDQSTHLLGSLKRNSTSDSSDNERERNMKPEERELLEKPKRGSFGESEPKLDVQRDSSFDRSDEEKEKVKTAKGEKKSKKGIFGRFRRKSESCSEASDDDSKNQKYNKQQESIEKTKAEKPAGKEKSKTGIFGRLRRKSKSGSDTSDEENEDNSRNKSREKIEAGEKPVEKEKSKKGIFGRRRKSATSCSDSSDDDTNDNKQRIKSEESETFDKPVAEAKSKKGIFGGIRRKSTSSTDYSDDEKKDEPGRVKVVGKENAEKSAGKEKKSKHGIFGRFRRKSKTDSDTSGDENDEKAAIKSNEKTASEKPVEKKKKGLFGRRRKSQSCSDNSDDENNDDSQRIKSEESIKPGKQTEEAKSKKDIFGRIRRKSKSCSDDSDDEKERAKETPEKSSGKDKTKKGIFGRFRRKSKNGSDTSDDETEAKNEIKSKENDHEKPAENEKLKEGFFRKRRTSDSSSDEGNQSIKCEESENLDKPPAKEKSTKGIFGRIRRTSKSSSDDSADESHDKTETTKIREENREPDDKTESGKGIFGRTRRGSKSCSDDSNAENEAEANMKSPENGATAEPNKIEKPKKGIFGRLRRDSKSSSDSSDDESNTKAKIKSEEKSSTEKPTAKSRKGLFGKIRRNSKSNSDSSDNEQDKNDGMKFQTEKPDGEDKSKKGPFESIRGRSRSCSGTSDDETTRKDKCRGEEANKTGKPVESEKSKKGIFGRIRRKSSCSDTSEDEEKENNKSREIEDSEKPAGKGKSKKGVFGRNRRKSKSSSDSSDDENNEKQSQNEQPNKTDIKEIAQKMVEENIKDAKNRFFIEEQESDKAAPITNAPDLSDKSSDEEHEKDGHVSIKPSTKEKKDGLFKGIKRKFKKRKDSGGSVSDKSGDDEKERENKLEFNMDSGMKDIEVLDYPQYVVLNTVSRPRDMETSEIENKELQDRVHTLKSGSDSSDHSDMEDNVIIIEPIIPKRSVEITDTKPGKVNTEAKKTSEPRKEPKQANEKGFFQQVKDKLMRHFSKESLLSDDSDDETSKTRSSDSTDKKEEFGHAIDETSASPGSLKETGHQFIPPEFQEPVCQSDDSSDDGSEKCGEWDARGFYSDSDDMARISDQDLAENMTYPEELSEAISNYRRNDKTRLSRVKISRYNAALDMYIPDEYKVSAAALKRHAAQSSVAESAPDKPSRVVKSDSSDDEKRRSGILSRRRKSSQSGSSDEDKNITREEKPITDVTMREEKPAIAPIPYQRGDRISELIDIYKFTLGEGYNKGPEEAAQRKRSKSSSSSSSSDDDKRKKKPDRMSIKSDKSLFKNPLKRNESKRQSQRSKRSVEVDVGKSRDSSADSHKVSIVGGIRFDRASRGSKSSTDTEKADTTSGITNPEGTSQNGDAIENVLVQSQSCDDLDKVGKGRRVSRLGSLRRSLSRRISRGLSLDNLHKSRDASSDRETDGETRKKKGWFSSLSRNKGNKIRKSQSMSVIPKAEKPKVSKSKSKDKKGKDKKSYDTETEDEGTNLKKSKSILSLNRFRNKDKKEKKKKKGNESDTDTESVLGKSKKKQKRGKGYDSDTDNETTKEKSRWGWRRKKRDGNESETDAEGKKTKEKKEKKKKDKKKKKEEKSKGKKTKDMKKKNESSESSDDENKSAKDGESGKEKPAADLIKGLFKMDVEGKIQAGIDSDHSDKESLASSRSKSTKPAESDGEGKKLDLSLGLDLTWTKNDDSSDDEKMLARKLSVNSLKHTHSSDDEKIGIARKFSLKSSKSVGSGQSKKGRDRKSSTKSAKSIDSDNEDKIQTGETSKRNTKTLGSELNALLATAAKSDDSSSSDDERKREIKSFSDTETSKKRKKTKKDKDNGDITDASDVESNQRNNKKYATMGRLKGKKVKKNESDDDDDDVQSKRHKRHKKEKKKKEKKEKKEKTKGIKKGASKMDVRDGEKEGEVNPQYSLEKVVRTITMCSADILFLIGREKDPSKSEVARLIQQSLEQDRRRAEAKQRLEEQQRMYEEEVLQQQALDDSLHNDSHEIEDGHVSPVAQPPPPLPVSPPPSEELRSDDDDDEAGLESTREEEELMLGNELITEDGDRADQLTGDSEPVSPELDPQVLFVKLKEAQYKNAVAEAELAKVKTKLAQVENDVIQQQKPADEEAMILLEKTEAQKRHYERKCEEMAARLRDTEKTLQQLQADMARYQDLLEGSQGQYIELEQSMKAEYGTLEKKYAKAKKLIKEYQTREKEIMQERESYVLQQSEKDQQYNEIVRKLKDKIFKLEKSLEETAKKAGLPAHVTPASRDSDIIIPAASVPVQRVMKPIEVDEISQLSDIDPDEPHPADTTLIEAHRDDVSLDSVPGTPLLDTAANKRKAQLASSGALATRRPPTRRSSQSESSTHEEDEEPFVVHGSDATMKKNGLHHRRKSSSSDDSAARKRNSRNELPTIETSGNASPKRLSVEIRTRSNRSSGASDKTPEEEPLSYATPDTFYAKRRRSSDDSEKSDTEALNISTDATSTVTDLTSIATDATSTVTDLTSIDTDATSAGTDSTTTVTDRTSPSLGRKIKNSIKSNLDKSDTSDSETDAEVASSAEIVVIQEKPVARPRHKLLNRDRDDVSDTSSIASQQSGSYDPNKADMAAGARSELVPTGVDEDDGGIQLISAKPKPGGATKLLSASSSINSTTSSMASSSATGGGGGGITLLAMRSIDNEYGPASIERNNGSLPQASTLSLDTGLLRRGMTHSRESSTGTVSSTHSGDLAESSHKSQSYDFTTAKLTTDSQGDGPGNPMPVHQSKKAQSMTALNQYQSTPVHDWTPHQVCHWLMALNLDQHAQSFLASHVDGPQLLALDNTKIKQLGVVAAKERDLLKKKVKELKTAIEREKKQKDKEQKAREKLEKQAAKQKKKK